MAKDIGMTIRKGIVVPFLPCLAAFWGFHPYIFFHFFVTCIIRNDYSTRRITTVTIVTNIEIINPIA